jgi:hypothetical protein
MQVLVKKNGDTVVKLTKQERDKLNATAQLLTTLARMVPPAVKQPHEASVALTRVNAAFNGENQLVISPGPALLEESEGSNGEAQK